MYLPLPWFYGQHQEMGSIIYLDVFSCAMNIWRAPNKVFHHLFWCIHLCRDSTERTKEGVPPYIWIYWPLSWLYTEHQRKCSSINLNVFSSVVVLWRKSRNVLHNILEGVALYRESMQSIKESVPPYISMYFCLPWFYAEHQTRCSTIYLNILFSGVIICRASKKVLHYLFECSAYNHSRG